MQRQTDRERGKEATRRVVAVARKQHGVVSLDQVPEISRETIRTAVGGGWLRRVHRGVYALSEPLSWRGIWMASVLACGPKAVLSHSSAAELWRMLAPTAGARHVIVPTRAGREHQSGITIHRPNPLDDADISTRDGIPVTTPARTLLDLAAMSIGMRKLERAADEAERLNLCDEGDIRRMLARNRRRPGGRRLGRLLAVHDLGSTATDLELEELFLGLCRDRGLPKPLVHHEVMGLHPDFFWPSAGLMVETDGRGSHATRRGFQDDRDRDSLLTAHGYRVLRFTWFDLTKRPAVVAERVRRALGSIQ